MAEKQTRQVPHGVFRRALSWLRHHKLDTNILVLLAVLSGMVSAWNMTGFPQRFEDEGTYISQAWAVKEKGELAHYTYWYDHPPLGWIQIAGWLTATDGLNRYDSAITAGREFMVFLHVATVLLLYAFARRLGLGKVASLMGTLLYSLSPLSIEFGRYVLLDNVALPWLIAAFYLAMHPKKHLSAAILSAVCMTIAIMSKETFLVLLPVLLYALWKSSDKRNRRYVLVLFFVTFGLLCSLYPLYALLKRELFPGEGHVSLIGTLIWQLFSRSDSGSIFEAGSEARGLAGYWLVIDPWLLAGGIVTMPFAIALKHTRVVGLAMLVGIVTIFRGGYLPYPYVIMLLPFAALCFAGVADAALRHLKLPDFNRRSFAKLSLAQMFLLACSAALLLGMSEHWLNRNKYALQADTDASSRQAVDWIRENVPRDSRMVVESALWSDLRDLGFNTPEPVWLYKTETDPEIVAEIGGWQEIDYVILNAPTMTVKDFDKNYPTVMSAVGNSTLVQTYGTGTLEIRIYRANDL